MNKQIITQHVENSMPHTFQKVAASAALDDQTRQTILANLPQAWLGKAKAVQPEIEGITALYTRLSSEDRLDSESNSIQNQKKILEKHCRDNGIKRFRHYEDDGWSGTNFQRPGFQAMLEDIKAGAICRVLVKDMSRFGRDYLQVGMYTDVMFPQLGVHFVAVNDGVDSKKGDNEFTAIRNIFNEMFARDTSKKIRATYQTRGRSGEHISSIPPYGYIKNPSDSRKWVVDESAAAVVQKVFALCAEGYGSSYIARWLSEHRILAPAAYMHANGIPCPTKPGKDPYLWRAKTIIEMLDRLEYLGHTVNFKTLKPSYKERLTINLSPDNWEIHEHTQQPIIDESTFMSVQNIRKHRRRLTKMGDMGMFSGLLFCADCGQRMYLCRASNFEPHQQYYICSTYRKSRDLCSTHTIRTVVLEELVLRNLREAMGYVSRYRELFIKEATQCAAEATDRELSRKAAALTQAEKRIAELDAIFKRLYEDTIVGKLSNERFDKLSGDYEAEQKTLTAAIKTLKVEIKTAKAQSANAKNFAAIVDRYVQVQELTPEILNAFVSKIYISAYRHGSEEREVTIEYNFIGAFEFGDHGLDTQERTA